MSKHVFSLLVALLPLSACDQRKPANEPEAAPQPSFREPPAKPVPEQSAPSTQDERAASINYSKDSLQYLALDSFELLTYRETTDTLQLVSTSPFLYYPFGEFPSLPAFQKNFPLLAFKRKTDQSDTSAKIYRGVFKSTFIKLFLDEEKKALEVVSGHIFTSEVKLVNGIATGMKKRAFFARFFKKPSTVEQNTQQVVELVSGLDGIRHYYTFKDDTLEHIHLDTDYQFDKR